VKQFLVKREKLLLVLFLLFFAILYSYISIAKHDRFETFGWDLAFQDQLIWKWSHFQIAFMSMKDNINSLGDHFTLTWLLLVPLYWIRPDPTTLLAAQAFVAVFAGFPLYFFAKKVIKSAPLALSITLLYLLFVSLQHGIFNDVHSTVFTTIFLASAYYFLETRRWPAYLLSIIGLTLTKEEFGLLAAAIGIVILIKKRALWPGLISIVYGLAIFFFLTVFLMPRLSGTPKFVHSEFGRLGRSVPEVVQTLIHRPDIIPNTLVDDPLKKDTLFKYFAASGFLPLLSPIDLIPIAQQINIRFLDNYHTVRWRADNHYSAPTVVLLIISLTYGLANLIRLLQKSKLKLNYHYILAALIFLLAIGQDLVFHGPVNSIFKPQFYQRQPWMADNQQIISLIPKEGSVTTNNDLAPHFSERTNLYFLPDVKGADYIAVDLLDGPNKYAPTDKENVVALIEQVKKDPDYVLVKQSGSAYLFKRVSSKSPTNLYDPFYRPQPL
jgi:uncharacterized membrane protein